MTHITIERAKLEQALEALEGVVKNCWRDIPSWRLDEIKAHITAIKQVLAAFVQEPVAQCMEHGECFGGKCIYTTPPAQPAPVQEPKEIAKLVEGMEVSIDVSTGDHDSGNRLFGTVTLAQENQGSKHGLILLVQDPEANFKTAAHPAPVQDEAWKAQQKTLADEAIKCATKAMSDPNSQAMKAVREYYGAAQPAPVVRRVKPDDTEGGEA